MQRILEAVCRKFRQTNRVGSGVGNQKIAEAYVAVRWFVIVSQAPQRPEMNGHCPVTDAARVKKLAPTKGYWPTRSA